jgi:histidine triad (HIT) family protein
MSKICIFCQIIFGYLNSEKVFENNRLLAFKDSMPVAPIHILIIPKLHITSIEDLSFQDDKLFSEMMLSANYIAKKEHCKSYRLVFNEGNDAGQSVFHLHMHLLGGRIMLWPPG